MTDRTTTPLATPIGPATYQARRTCVDALGRHDVDRHDLVPVQ